MTSPLVNDMLWQLIEPLLPRKIRRFRYPGRIPVDNRAALGGILFVLKTRVPWEFLPQEMGCGSGMTCWRRLREWQRVGIWDAMKGILCGHLPDAHTIDWTRADGETPIMDGESPSRRLATTPSFTIRPREKTSPTWRLPPSLTRPAAKVASS